MSVAAGRHDGQAAYVLHSYPFRETSLIVEAFTRDCGRVALVARGARRPRSAVRGMLLAFQPLLLGWAGKAELHTLVRAEWLGGVPQLTGRPLLCGFYLNELLLRLLAREDPHEGLYAAYAAAIGELAREVPGAEGERARLEAVLRRFEKRLLVELGYGLNLQHEGDTGRPLVAAGRYAYVVDKGAIALERAPAGPQVEVCGKTLLDMAADDYSDPTTAQQGKALMRSVINHYLGSQPLHTRQLLKDMQQL